MVTSLGSNLLSLKDTLPVFCCFLDLVGTAKIPQELAGGHPHVPGDHIPQQLIHKDLS